MRLTVYSFVKVLILFIIASNSAAAQKSVILYGPYVSNFKINGDVKFRKINRFKTEEALAEGLEKYFGKPNEFIIRRDTNVVLNYIIEYNNMSLLFLNKEGWPELYDMELTGDDVKLVFGDFEFKIKTSIKTLRDRISSVKNFSVAESNHNGYYLPHFHGHSYYFELMLGADGDTIEKITIYTKLGI